MRTIERARWLLSRDPHGPSVRVLQRLLHALETGGDFNIAELAILPHDRYELALDVLRDWRKDRYHQAGAQASLAGGVQRPAHHRVRPEHRGVASRAGLRPASAQNPATHARPTGWL